MAVAFVPVALSLHFLAALPLTDNILLFLLLALSFALGSLVLTMRRRPTLPVVEPTSRAEGSLEEIANICKVIVWQVDSAGVFTQIIGWQGINQEIDPADLLGRDIDVLKGDYPEFYALLQRAQDGEEFVDYSDFGTQTYQHSYSKLAAVAGRAGGFQCISLDVGEDQRLYNRLAFTEQLIATSGKAVVIFNRNRQLLSVNQAFTRMTGFSRQELLALAAKGGEHSGLIAHPDAAFFKSVLQTLKQYGQWTGEVALRRRSGEQFSANVSLSAIRGNGGSLTHYAAFFSDLSHMKRSHEELRYLATHDNLTDLPNRRLFLDRLDQGIQRAKRNQRQLAVFFIDLDNFKLINDTLGHHFGDDLLKEIARRLLTVVRQSDTVARLAGDEFTVIAENIHDLGEVRAIAEKILTCFEKIFAFNDQQLEATASVGIAVYPDDGADLDSLMKQADGAMYKAKAAGRNGYYSLHDGESSRASARQFYPSELRLALKRKQMSVVYQPLFDIQQRRVVGCECLLRWNHHARGLIKPGDFMLVSEEAGITTALGEWTLNEVCSQMRSWQLQGMDVAYVSINIEMSQIADPAYPELILDALEQQKLDASCLMFEIGEELVLANLTQVTQFIRTLNQMGIRFCIDGFGSSGKNSNYLKNLPVEALKLDHRLLMRVNGTRQHIDLIQALTGIGDILDKTVIAVGVERVRQEEVLAEIGCHFAQGFLYGKPMSAEYFGKSYQQLAASQGSRLN
ncbi:MAG: EAL domain-containing protein [Porticoccaceae bacterium]|nr:EAL domain-containing protein [Porticoccaceae bacterium]